MLSQNTSNLRISTETRSCVLSWEMILPLRSSRKPIRTRMAKVQAKVKVVEVVVVEVEVVVVEVARTRTRRKARAKVAKVPGITTRTKTTRKRKSTRGGNLLTHPWTSHIHHMHLHFQITWN